MLTELLIIVDQLIESLRKETLVPDIQTTRSCSTITNQRVLIHVTLAIGVIQCVVSCNAQALDRSDRHVCTSRRVR